MTDRGRTRARGHDRRAESHRDRQSQAEYDDEYDDEPADEYDGEDYDDEPDRGGSERTPVPTRMSVVEIAEAGLRQISEITSKNPAGVTSVEPAEDGWVVGVEVVEDRRVPSSADILALYEAEIGADGKLMSYRRTKRYPRGRGDDGGAGG